jgi:hypothetical protein
LVISNSNGAGLSSASYTFLVLLTPLFLFFFTGGSANHVTICGVYQRDDSDPELRIRPGSENAISFGQETKQCTD